MSETELRNHIEGCKRQDRSSQKWLFDRYYRLMFGICLRYASDHDAAQDIVQEGYLKVFNNIEGYTSKGSFEGWMRRIMVNTAIDAIRRDKASGWILADENSMELLANEVVVEVAAAIPGAAAAEAEPDANPVGIAKNLKVNEKQAR